MQSNSGLLRWLKVPFLYNAFQGAVGGSALRRSLIEKHVRPKAGDNGAFRTSSILGSTSIQIILRLPSGHTVAGELS